MALGPLRDLDWSRHHALKERAVALEIKVLGPATAGIGQCANSKHEVDEVHWHLSLHLILQVKLTDMDGMPIAKRFHQGPGGKAAKRGYAGGQGASTFHGLQSSDRHRPAR